MSVVVDTEIKSFRATHYQVTGWDKFYGFIISSIEMELKNFNFSTHHFIKHFDETAYAFKTSNVPATLFACSFIQFRTSNGKKMEPMQKYIILDVIST